MNPRNVLRIFDTVGNALNSPSDTAGMLAQVARSVVEHLDVRGCHFRLLSRDRKRLEHVAAHGLSEGFLEKGPVDAERSVAEALEGRLVMVADCARDPRIQYPRAFVEEGLSSMLVVPLTAREQVIGVMRLFTAEQREFDEQELEVVETVADMAAAAIVHSMFQQILRHVSQSIRSTLELGEVLSSIAAVIAEDLRARGTFIGLVTGREPGLEMAAASGLGDAFLRRVEGEPGAAVRAALAGESVAVLDARTDPRIPWAGEAGQERFTSLLCVPLTLPGAETIGVLGVATHQRYAFSSDEIHLLGAIGEQCALAIRHAQMYAALKRRYEETIEDFHTWFDHVHVSPRNG
jgi:GAF domain-containing protein